MELSRRLSSGAINLLAERPFCLVGDPVPPYLTPSQDPPGLPEAPRSGTQAPAAASVGPLESTLRPPRTGSASPPGDGSSAAAHSSAAHSSAAPSSAAPSSAAPAVRTLAPPAAAVPLPAIEPQKLPKPRIVDASGGFDLNELADSDLPSTVVGEDEDDDALMDHRAVKIPEPGQRVGRYLTEEILGKGGMGLVLRARDDLLQRNVAIKVILPQYLAADPAAGLRFLREAEIVARLAHPHIIRVLDAGLDAGVAYLTFEYIEGETFSILRSGPDALDPTEVVDLMLPVISAVHCAHQLGVVHGDLKPSNLLLSQDYAGRPHPWVLDFGVSFFSDVEAGLDPTRKKVTGTAGYLAPEWLERKGVDGRADCFSLGCVLYELLAGKGPFAGITRLSQALACAKDRDYPHLPDVCRASEALTRVVEHALCPDVEGRVQSAAALGLALLPFASEEFQLRYQPEFEMADSARSRLVSDQ